MQRLNDMEKLELTHFVGFHKSHALAGLSSVNSISAGNPRTVSTTGKQQTILNMAESKPLRYVDVGPLLLRASPSKGYATHS